MSLLSEFAEGWAEATAEHIKRTTPLSYWCNVFEFQYSPKSFYALVEQNLAKWQVPDLLQGYILMREGTVFSPKRLYLQMRRERIVFEICAAPFGTGFFVSSRLFDRRREATWVDYLIAAFLSLGIGALAWSQFGLIPSVVVVGFVVTTIWSVMRLGVSVDATWLDEQITKIPSLGRIYESLFHPNTYFRQDQTNMYREVVHSAVMRTIEQMTSEKGQKPPSELASRPTVNDLHKR